MYLNNDKNGKAAKILKEFFNKKTQLGKEYEFIQSFNYRKLHI